MSYQRFKELQAKVQTCTATGEETLEFYEMTKHLDARSNYRPPQESSFIEDVATTALGVATGDILGSALGGLFGGGSDDSGSSSSSDWAGGGGDFSGGGASGDW